MNNIKDQIPPRYLRREDAARHLGISPRTLADWQKRRVISFRKVGRAVLFRADELDTALDRFVVAAVGEPKALAASPITTAPTAPASGRKRRAGRIATS